MYIKYIYQLYDMNCRLQNKIEAGHTLMLHARLLDVNLPISLLIIRIHILYLVGFGKTS